LTVHDSRLSDILSEVVSGQSEINVSLLCSHDGFPMAFAISSEAKEDIVILSAMTSAVHSISNQAVTQLNTGPLLTTTIEGAKGTLLLKSVGDYLFACHVPKKEKELGARVRSYHIGIALDVMEASAEKILHYLINLDNEPSE
jgi:predicted regulator of Ras-like GTPase activity (Roadblock/LC7/MglB family)